MNRNIHIGQLAVFAVVGAAAYFLVQFLFPKGADAKIETLGLAIGWGGSILIGLIGLAVVYGMFVGTIDLSKLVSEANGDASMSRFQFLIFTFVISLCLLVITVSHPGGPQFPLTIPPEILGLLGISAGSYVVSKSLQNSAAGPAAGVPAVTLAPSSVAAVAGQAATLTASATGNGTLSYEWQRATPGSADWQTVPGENRATLGLTLAEVDHGAQYRCKVTNADGSTLSAPVIVSVASDRG